MTEGPDAAEPVGAWLRKQREAAGLSQEDIADRSGLSVRAISDLERGRTHRPYPKSLRRLVDALGLPETVGQALVARYRTGRDDIAQAAPSAGPPVPGAAAAPIVPRQLPAAAAYFAGRAGELKALSALAGRVPAQADVPGGTVVISAIGGTAGVGKTALAVHWAHQAADRFPDGQLYVNLRGFDPSAVPVAPLEAVRGFLHALDVHPARIPAGLDAQAALYRSLLAGRRMLIVLDNARDSEQVRPLLPGLAGCLVVVTSRSQLTGLAATDAADIISLDVLTEAEAVELLAARLGPARVAAEAEASLELARLCARLPVALAVAAAFASATPGRPMAALAVELADAHDRLDALDTGDAAGSVRAVFSWSYRQLGPDTARLFRLLGLHPGPDITALAAASLAGVPLREVRRGLRELTRATLLTERTSGRYAFHDLLRAYAAEQAAAVDSDADRRAALGRMLDHYLHTAWAAALQLDPARDRLALPPPREGTAPERPADYDEALAWLDAERPVLLAAVRLAADAGFYPCAWVLPSVVTDFFYLRGHWHDMAANHEIALAAARRQGDRAGQALASRHLARALSLLGSRQDAEGRYREALEVFRQLGDDTGQARCHYGLAWAGAHEGRYDVALDHGRQALAHFRAAWHRDGEAMALNAIGWFHAHRGEHGQAIDSCEQALALCRELGDRHSEAATWDSLGYARHLVGQHAEAVGCYDRALVLFRELHDRNNEAATLINLGDTHHAAADTAAARAAWQQAAGILDELHHPDAAQVRARLRHPG